MDWKTIFRPIEWIIKLRITAYPDTSVTDTLAALKSIKGRLTLGGVYSAVAGSECTRMVAEEILKNKQEIISLVKRGAPPNEIALALLERHAFNEVALGNHHSYRGRLSDLGQGYLNFYCCVSKLCVDEGLKTQEVFEKDMDVLKEEIAAAG